MLIDGKKIRDELLATLKDKFAQRNETTLAIVVVGNDLATQKFIEQKKKIAARLGVRVAMYEFPPEVSFDELEACLTRLATWSEINGIIVQLPLPRGIDAQAIINLIPPEKDIDALSNEAKVLSPVVAAVEEILRQYDIPLVGPNFLVLGQGKLVGRPTALWLVQSGAIVEVADHLTGDLSKYTKNADVIICGVGQPGLLHPEMVKDGVVIIDAGTSEQAGKMSGDADPACATKAKLFTPVPGGVGPVVVAELFNNLWKLLA